MSVVRNKRGLVRTRSAGIAGTLAGADEESLQAAVAALQVMLREAGW